ncbi:hypothetical protein JJL45_05350 [Tamlana sp. s12]|uniref:hypothetical protein n=1 Tax=Tamlana sp. s12 TaxID=1630406 RepID=UPI00192BCFB0|nr:hypothetical protein [Tamlana sp. s12]QQY83418.1 hypothetical protein JJL45_05350 [Tamlana sp. s12]
MKQNMKLQSKINAIKSRINQIESSDMFSDDEKKVLLKYNNKELDIYETKLRAEAWVESKRPKAVLMTSNESVEFRNSVI